TSEVGEIGQRLATGQSVIERELAGDVTHALVYGDRIGARFDPEHVRVPAGRTDQVQDRPDRGRLARAVWPKEAKHLPGLDLEIDVDDPAVRAVGLGE